LSLCKPGGRVNTGRPGQPKAAMAAAKPKAKTPGGAGLTAKSEAKPQ